MTKPHWEEWLRDARVEKKRRRNETGSSDSKINESISSEKSKDVPQELPRKKVVPKKALNKQSIKSINRLVKKKEADASVSILKDALEHLWSNVMKSTKPQQVESPYVPPHPVGKPTINTSFSHPSAKSAKEILADIQAEVAIGNVVDKEGYV